MKAWPRRRAVQLQRSLNPVHGGYVTVALGSNSVWPPFKKEESSNSRERVSYERLHAIATVTIGMTPTTAEN